MRRLSATDTNEPRRLELAVQDVSGAADVPPRVEIRRWVEAALETGGRRGGVLTVRIVTEAESAALNRRYRRRGGPTNVLSFPFEDPPGVRTGILGDLVVCASVVAREARTQGIAPRAHWAHVVVHGVLHLCGYEHGRRGEAHVMHRLEDRILAGLGFGEIHGPHRGHR